MKKAKRDRLFYKYEKMGYKVAKRFSDRFGVPYQPLADESLFILVRYVAEEWDFDFKNHKGSESTWMYQVFYWQLMNVILGKSKDFKTNKNEVPFSTLAPDGRIKEPPAREDWLGKLFAEISEEARALVNTVIDAPAEIADVMVPRTCGRAREAVRQYLIDEKDWSNHRLDKAWAEVQSCL